MQHVVEKLHKDHEKVEQIFGKLMDTGENAEKSRADLCRKLSLELKAHTRFEEEVFYPAIRDIGEAPEGDVQKLIDEHHEVEEMLERLDRLEPTSDGFMEEVSALKDAVQKHVRREEDEIFPIAERGIGEEDAERMARRHDEMADDFKRQAAE